METRQKLQKAILRGVVGQASSLPLRASCPRNFVLGLEARGGRQDVCPTTLAVRFEIGGKLFRDKLIDPRRSFANEPDRVCV